MRYQANSAAALLAMFSFGISLAADSPPWQSLSRRQLEPFFRVKTQELESVGWPNRITLLQQHSLTFILDSVLGQVRVLDAEYDHTYSATCVPLFLYGGSLPSGRSRCSTDPGDPRYLQVRVRRGVLEGTVLALADRPGPASPGPARGADGRELARPVLLHVLLGAPGGSPPRC